MIFLAWKSKPRQAHSLSHRSIVKSCSNSSTRSAQQIIIYNMRICVEQVLIENVSDESDFRREESSIASKSARFYLQNDQIHEQIALLIGGRHQHSAKRTGKLSINQIHVHFVLIRINVNPCRLRHNEMFWSCFHSIFGGSGNSNPVQSKNNEGTTRQ